jgi:hypothetical protein
VKTLAGDASKAAELAVASAPANKQKAQADATALVAALRKALPDASAKIAAAKRISGVKLDFAALTLQLTAAKATLADADNDLSAGNYAAALQKATAVQTQMDDGAKMISDAVAAATNKKK